MCPLCLSTAAWVIAGVTSTGGVAVIALGRRAAKTDEAVEEPRPDGLRRVNRSTTKEAV